MLQALLNLLGAGFDRVVSFVSSRSALLFLFFINPVLLLIGLVLYLITSLETYLNDMMSLAVSPSGQMVSFNTGSMVGVANYFIPLEMMFGCISLLLSLWVAAVVYRFVKSWIPTVN